MSLTAVDTSLYHKFPRRYLGRRKIRSGNRYGFHKLLLQIIISFRLVLLAAKDCMAVSHCLGVAWRQCALFATLCQSYVQVVRPSHTVVWYGGFGLYLGSYASIFTAVHYLIMNRDIFGGIYHFFSSHLRFLLLPSFQYVKKVGPLKIMQETPLRRPGTDYAPNVDWLIA